MTNHIVEMRDRKVILSTLWIFAMFNYIYAAEIMLSTWLIVKGFNPSAIDPGYDQTDVT